MKTLKSVFSVVTLSFTLNFLPPGQAMEHGSKVEAQDLSKIPPRQVEMYLDGFHNYKTDLKVEPEKQLQLRVAHFCVHNSPDLIQCMLFDTNGSVPTKHPRLLGVEYVITDKVYQALPDEEKQYWHPHDGEVSSGMLVLPGMAKADQDATLKFVSTTWGKTWHAWNPERKVEGKDSTLVFPDIPMGPAQLMWSVKPEDATELTKQIVKEREKKADF